MARQLFGTDGVRGLANAELSPISPCAWAARPPAGRATAAPPGRTWSSGATPAAPARCSRTPCARASRGRAASRCGPACCRRPAWRGSPARRTQTSARSISASHNPYPDNGIKLFGGDGFKLTDGDEERVEALLGPEDEPRVGGDVGWSRNLEGADERYAAWVAETVDVPLAGVHVVVDCANGAATTAAPLLLERLGVRTTVVANAPDGTNINVDCGSTHLGHVAGAVRGGARRPGPRLRRRRRSRAGRRRPRQRRGRRSPARDPGARRAGAGRPARQQGRPDVHGEPRRPSRPGGAGRRAAGDRRRRPLRAGRDAQLRRGPRRRAVRARDRARPPDDR